jgi:5-oxoprolinase (ATP-hydrolysing) subunit A
VSSDDRPRVVDLNADLGEVPGDEALYPLVSSANIACGGHAGDERSMRHAVRRALEHGVSVGSHPSYPDSEGFGRLSIEIDPGSLEAAITEQVGTLARIAASLGAGLSHVKPHGALYNDAARNAGLARTVARAVGRVSADLVLFGLAGSAALDVWREMGFRVAAEGFADRGYRDDGTLVPRSEPGALIIVPAEAAAQAVRLALSGRVETICVHSDMPDPPATLRAIRAGLLASGIRVAALAPMPPRT